MIIETMADTFSNYLKVVFVPEDLCEMSEAILRSNCMTVQHFNYESKREHDAETGTTYHREDSTVLDFTVRINTPDCGKQILAHMQDYEQHAYSFLFNATFKTTGRLDDYDDALMAVGSIIDVEEKFDTIQKTGQQEQMLMHVKLLLNSITFIGKENNLKMVV